MLLALPVPLSAQGQCTLLNDTTATRHLITPPLVGIRTVFVQTSNDRTVDPYSTLTKIAAWHVGKAGLSVVDSLNRADAMIHITLRQDYRKATVGVEVAWERSYRNAAGLLQKAKVYQMEFDVPGVPESIDLQQQVEDAVSVLLFEWEWQNCTK
jgi:hypothetical protein